MSIEDPYATLTVYMSWHGFSRPSLVRDVRSSGEPRSTDMAAFFMNMQLAYEAVCNGLEYPSHDLQVVMVNHPNMSVSLKGLGEPIRALRDLIQSMPDIVVGFCTIPKKIKAKNSELEREIAVDTAISKIVEDAVRAHKSAEKNQKRILMEEVLRYQLGDKNFDTLDVHIGETEIKGEKKSTAAKSKA